MTSLRTRLLAAASVVLALFVVITGFALAEANRERAVLAQLERMRGLVYALLGAAEVDDTGAMTVIPEILGEPRFVQPASGLEAVVFDARGHAVWHSPSALGPPLESAALPVDEWRFTRAESGKERFALGYGVRWYIGDQVFRFTLQVSEDAGDFFGAEAAFERRLWLWLGVPTVMLLLLQLAVVTWAIRPLRHMAEEVRALERSEQQRVTGRYPRELMPLKGALNTLLSAEQTRVRRHRDALEDLAHSLKTPLAATQVLTGRIVADQRQPIQEQLERMDDIIRYQLTRAAAKVTTGLHPAVSVAPVAQRLRDTMAKVHAQKELTLRIDGDPACTARIDEDALFEVVGNLMDNACKWARREVVVAVACNEGGTRIQVDDDGPGFPDTDLAQWLERGTRADRRQAGQGLGLSVAYDILRAAGGNLELSRSPSGGARVSLVLPA